MAFSSEEITSEEMKALEMNAEYFGVSSLQMMENAGSIVARAISSRFKPEETRIAVFAGTGGNGGDGLVAARHLSCLGFKVRVLLIGRSDDIKRDIVRRNWEAINFMSDSTELTVAHDSSLIPKIEAEVVVDALLGTGAKGPLKPPILQVCKGHQ